MIPFDEAQVRFHGNGFLQAEDGKGGKFHMWHPACPRQKTRTFLHNHNHGFNSTIMYGSLTNVEYRLESFDSRTEGYPPWTADYWLKYQCVPREGKDTVLEPTWYWCLPIHRRSMLMTERSCYDFPLDENLFHETLPVAPVVITHVVRGKKGGWEPTVVAPPDTRPDNDFNRYGFPDEARSLYITLVALLEGKHGI